MNYLNKLIIIVMVLISTAVDIFALKAEYRFENCDGTITTKNNQGSSLNGTLGGDAEVTIDGGKIKNGLTLSGEGMMSVEHDKNLDLVNSLTITFWVNPKEKGRQALIVKGDGGGKGGANAEYSLVLWEDGRVKYKHNNSADTFSKSKIALNEWSHIALVRNSDDSSIKIYIDGTLDSSNSYTIEPSSSNSEKLLIGTGDFYSDTMQNFNGKIDEVKIYNLPLSKEEISSIYLAENGGEYYTKGCTQTHKAPEAIDNSGNLPIDGEVVVDVLSNDIVYNSDRCELNSSTVRIVSDIENSYMSDDNKSLTVKNEGVWMVLDIGLIKFISDDNFYDNPTDISYTVNDTCGATSNSALVSLTRVSNGKITPTESPISTPKPTATPEPTPTIMATSIPDIVKKSFNIGDRVWFDRDKNGIQDVGEGGVDGVIVVLYDNKGSVVDKVTTNSSGEYMFRDVKVGTYSIGFTNIPKGYIFTTQDVSNDNSKDSDVNSIGRVSNIKVDRDNMSFDAGVIESSNTKCQTTLTDETKSGEDCECESYDKSVPAFNNMGILSILILMGLLGSIFIKREESYLNIQ